MKAPNWRLLARRVMNWTHSLYPEADRGIISTKVGVFPIIEADGIRRFSRRDRHAARRMADAFQLARRELRRRHEQETRALRAELAGQRQRAQDALAREQETIRKVRMLLDVSERQVSIGIDETISLLRQRLEKNESALTNADDARKQVLAELEQVRGKLARERNDRATARRQQALDWARRQHNLVRKMDDVVTLAKRYEDYLASGRDGTSA